MTTAAPKLTRAEAARLNGAKSRGPVTEEGKRRAAQNALKHGLTAETHCVLKHEDPAAYKALLDRLVAHHRPSDPDRVHLVERLASVMWRQRRLDRLEAALFDQHTWKLGEEVHLRVDIASYEALQRSQVRLDRQLFQILKALRETGPEDEDGLDAPANDDAAPVQNEPESRDRTLPVTDAPAPPPLQARPVPNEPEDQLLAPLGDVDIQEARDLRARILGAGPGERVQIAKIMELTGLIEPDELRRILDHDARQGQAAR